MNCLLFFFNDTATTEIYTLSLHDALPICAEFLRILRPGGWVVLVWNERRAEADGFAAAYERLLEAHGTDYEQVRQDRKSTRLNSSHANISYAVFCLKKKILLSAS